MLDKSAGDWIVDNCWRILVFVLVSLYVKHSLIEEGFKFFQISDFQDAS